MARDGGSADRLINGAASLTLAKWGVATLAFGAAASWIGLIAIGQAASVRAFGPMLLISISAFGWYFLSRGRIEVALTQIIH